MASSNGTKARSRAKIQTLTPEQVLGQLDRGARKLLGISGAEFLKRLDTGEIEYGPDEIGLAALASLAR